MKTKVKEWAKCLEPTCGYEWEKRVPEPKACPECKSRKWNEGGKLLSVTEGPPLPNPSHWVSILTKDDRWSTVSREYIYEIEHTYGDAGVNLSLEATECFKWLNFNPKGKKKKDANSTWLNWLKKAKADLPQGYDPNLAPEQRIESEAAQRRAELAEAAERER